MIKGKRLNSRNRQQGVFAIEMALVSTTIVLFLAFISDLTSQQSTLGQLQRLSYSAASIIKERKELYGGDANVTESQKEQIFDIAQSSLARTMASFDSNAFSMHLEQQNYKEEETGPDGAKKIEAVADGNTIDLRSGCETVELGGKDIACTCTAEKPLGSYANDLGVITSYGRAATLYQVTFCYTSESWFGKIAKAVGINNYSTIQASTMMLGR